MRDDRGFSLPEVLVALLILTVVITMSLAAFVERSRRLQQASDMILAYQALANEAEYQRRVDFANLANGEFKTENELPALLAPLGDYGATVRVDKTQAGIKNVTMTVRWKNGQREAKLALVRVDTGGTNLW